MGRLETSITYGPGSINGQFPLGIDTDFKQKKMINLS